MSNKKRQVTLFLEQADFDKLAVVAQAMGGGKAGAIRRMIRGFYATLGEIRAIESQAAAAEMGEKVLH
jgi:hypothetical protein